MLMLSKRTKGERARIIISDFVRMDGVGACIHGTWAQSMMHSLGRARCLFWLQVAATVTAVAQALQEEDEEKEKEREASVDRRPVAVSE